MERFPGETPYQDLNGMPEEESSANGEAALDYFAPSFMDFQDRKIGHASLTNLQSGQDVERIPSRKTNLAKQHFEEDKAERDKLSKEKGQLDEDYVKSFRWARRENADQTTDALDRNAAKTYEYYEKHPAEAAKEWTMNGVVAELKRGQFDLPEEQVMYAGLWDDRESILERIDPDGIFGHESIQAETDVKLALARYILDENPPRLTPEALKKARRAGIEKAVAIGAEVDPWRHKATFTMPVDKADELKHFMLSNGVDPEANTLESEDLRLESYDGFFNIVRAMAEDPKSVEEGKKRLDWYYDTFGYRKHLDEFMTAFDSFRNESDVETQKILDDYRNQHPDGKRWQQFWSQFSMLDLQGISGAVPVGGKGVAQIDALIKTISGGSEEMFPDEGFFKNWSPMGGSPDTTDLTDPRVRSFKQRLRRDRCNVAVQKAKEILVAHPDANINVAKISRNTDTDDLGQPLNPFAVQSARYGNNNRIYVTVEYETETEDEGITTKLNNVIAMPVTGEYAAVYAWCGMGDWRPFFTGSIRSHGRMIFRHVAHDYTNRGMDSLQREMELTEHDLEKRRERIHDLHKQMSLPQAFLQAV